MHELQNVYEVIVPCNNTNKKYNVVGTNVLDALSNLRWRGRPYDYFDIDEQHQQANKEWDDYVNAAQEIKLIMKNVIV